MKTLVCAGWLAAWAATPVALAQSVSTAATSITGADGRSWAFLTWNSDDPTFVQRAVVAVYRKAGLPTTPGDYTLVSVVRRTDDAAVMRAALQQSQHVGQDLVALDTLIQSSFGTLPPDPALPLEEKLRILIASARTDENLDHTLQFLARSQPGVSAAAGQAFITEVPTGSPTTFELRLCDSVPADPAAECRNILARITVVGGVSTPLPTPGAPMEVSWHGPRGDLNVRLIWATPTPLRAEWPLHAGFHVYRVTPAFFAANYSVTPPNPGALARASQTDPGAVRRVTVQPAYPDYPHEDPLTQEEVLAYRALRDTHAAAAADGRDDERTDDAIPFFVVDDNRRFEAGGVRFNDGDQFYYYVVARDLLGREGVASPPTLVTLCVRRSPATPQNVSVEVTSRATSGVIGAPVTEDLRDQLFKIRWRRNPTNREAVTTDAYRLYRWDSPDQPTKPGARATAELKEIPAGDLSTITYETVDDSPSRPTLPAADQKTYWYTLRAVRRAPCGDVLLSDHSAPVFGVLRSWQGPPRASGELSVLCAPPQVQFVSWTTQTVAIPSPNVQALELICDRTNRSALWAEFYLAAANVPDPTGAGLAGDRFLGRVWFRDGESRATLNTQIRRTFATVLRVRCRVGTADGAVSQVADGVFTPPDPKNWPKVRATFRSLPIAGQRVPLGSCGHHATRHPDTGRLEPIGVTLHYTGSAREHRIYVSIDDGPLDLVARGSGPLLATREELFTGFPANAAKLCFYAEFLDSQGLAGPKEPLGCLTTPGQQDLPIPMLAKPEGATAPGGALTVAALKWFCPPFAVERFRLLVGVEDLAALPARISSALYESPATRVEVVAGKSYRVYETGKVGGNFGQPGESNFTAAVDALPGVHYTFLLQAVSAAGAAGGFSEPAEFQWSSASPPGASPLAWPARALPAVRAAAARFARGDVSAAAETPPQLFDPDAWTDGPGRLHLGVLIGETTGAVITDPQSRLPTLEGVINANDLVGFLSDTDPAVRPAVFPCALYRYQVANAAFPQVSGDVIQVSPLMQGIAHRNTGTAGSLKTLFVDPFVDLRAVLVDSSTVVRIYLKDTQPAVREAAYRYLLVQFTPLGEIKSVTQTPAVTIP